jgi:hypothetical protein
MQLQDREILNKYLLSLFGVEKFVSSDPGDYKTLRRAAQPDLTDDGFDEEGKSYILQNLLMVNLDIEDELFNKLETYDSNIKEYVEHISENRDNVIDLKYFQYFAVLFTEIFLDRYFNSKEKLLIDINEFVDKENKKIKKDKRKYSYFEEDDLNKLAYYMATGSGKTLIMHINFLQFLKYNKTKLDNIILITPNERLTKQHIEEFKISNIDVDHLNNMGGGLIGDKDIYVIEIHKLKENKTGEGESVEISTLEGNNLVFVDEGHKGMQGAEWKSNREALARDGFLFEYSATFGQAIGDRIDRSEKVKNEYPRYNEQVALLGLDKEVRDKVFNINKNNTYINMSKYQLDKKLENMDISDYKKSQIKQFHVNLLEEYSKAVIFDYSYRYFYHDGYGKDYNILNLKDSQLKEYNFRYMLANLLSFYEQKKYYVENKKAIKKYNLENPLLVFVGDTVLAPSGSMAKIDNKSVSDIEFVIKFIKDLFDNKEEIIKNIENILNKKSGFEDENDRDIFDDKFRYLKSKNIAARKIYNEILELIFNTSNITGELELYNIQGGDGEIGLKLKGSKDYFGLINIGNSSKLIDKFEEDNYRVKEDEFSDSLFTDLNDTTSKVNLLIGSKKFTEGWNSYRVSNIGILNLGRSRGSQIIQLFGRGVRIKGLNGSLKRSEAFNDVFHPDYINILETLNIFGIRADYMEEFRKYLEEEGIEDKDDKEIILPIKENNEFLNKSLYTIKIKKDANFVEEELIELKINNNISIEVDLRPKTEIVSSFDADVEFKEDSQYDYYYFNQEQLELMDWNEIYLDLVRYKKKKNYKNLLIKKEKLKEILDNKNYKVYCEEDTLKMNKFADLEELQDIVKKILKKYVTKFYKTCHKHYQDEKLIYETLTREDPNFQDYVIKLDRKKYNLIDEVEDLIQEEKEIFYSRDFNNNDHFNNIYFDRHLFQPLLCKTGEIKTTPQGLEDSEEVFINLLKEYLESDEAKEIIKDKEIFLLRNLTRSKGVCFMDDVDRYYPDFMLWIKDDQKQYLSFIDPKGIHNLGEIREHPKVQLANTIKEQESKIAANSAAKEDMILNSYIMSYSDFESSKKHYNLSRDEFNKLNILFIDDKSLNKYNSKPIDKLFKSMLGFN